MSKIYVFIFNNLYMKMKEVRTTLFSERVKELRIERGLTQAQLASKLGFNRGTVGDWETRGKEPSFITLCDIASLFDVTIDYLLGYSDVND